MQDFIFKPYVLIILVQFTWLAGALAQEVPLEYFGTDEGLPEPRIDHLRILKDGTLLIGTSGHPILYDGYEFQIVDRERRHWFINSSYDNIGTIWLINMQGSLYGYDGKRIFDHPVADSMARLANMRKRHISLAFDSSRTAYIGMTGMKYYVKAFQDGSVERVSTDGKYLLNSAFVERRHTATPYFGSTARSNKSDTGFLYIDGQIIEQFDHPLTGRVHYLEKDSLQVVSVGRKLFFLKDGQVSQRDLGHSINALRFDRQNKLWVGHSAGAGFIDFRNSEHFQSVLENRMVTSIAIDYQGHTWIGTTNGLFKALSSSITNYYEGGEKRLSTESATEIVVHKNKLNAIGNNDIFEFKGGEFRSDHAYKGPKSMVLASSINDGFWTLNTYGPHFHGADGSYSSAKIDRVSGMASYSKDSTVWLSRGHRLIQLDKRGETIKSIRLDSVGWGKDMPDDPRVKVIGMDHYNPCISIEMKLFIYEGDSLRKVYYESMGRKLKYISCVKNFGNFTLVGTRIGGLWVLDEDTFYQLGTNNGLVSDNVRDVAAENDSTWWIATNMGIHRVVFNIKKGGFRYKSNLIDKSNGLPTSSTSMVLVHNDTLWISTRDGVSGISLDIYNASAYKLPPTHISWVRVNGLNKSYSAALELKPKENQLSFGFKAVSFQPLNQKKYAYRLLGENENWQTTTDTFIRYTALPAGDFVFEVRTLGEDPTTLSPVKRIAFSISKPYWQRTWFIIVALLLAQLIAGLGVWLANRSKRRRLSLEKNVLTAELKALRAQLNPHFMFNALGAIQGSIMEGSSEEALQNIGKLAHLMRKMLYATRNKRTTLKETLEVLKLYLDLELVRQPGKFSYDIEYDESCKNEMETINIPPSIIQPFVENAVLHGASKANNKGLIKVKFEQFKDYIKCEISDNGPGYYKSQKQKKGQHRSLGMSIVKEQIDLLNMDLESKITLNIEERMGTIVTVMMPVDF